MKFINLNVKIPTIVINKIGALEHKEGHYFLAFLFLPAIEILCSVEHEISFITLGTECSQ